MRIESSTLSFAAAHREGEAARKTATLRAWGGPPPGAGDGLSRREAPATYAPPQTAPPPRAAEEEEAAVDDPRLLLVRLVVEALTGRKVRLLRAEDVGAGAEAPAVPSPQAEDAARAGPAGWGVDLRTTEVRVEEEAAAVASEGVVRTADGREIAVSVEVVMARRFEQVSETRVLAGDAARLQDPLVVNLGAGPATLGPLRFAFDLDADGAAESLPGLGSGSAFLALDRNGNGRADDGTELFGPASGDGFADLAALDGDGNGWIDEADQAWGELRLWVPGGEGLLGLAEGGIGALSIDRVASPFALKDGANVLQGQVRATGLYLREDGSAGTVQQVDLVA